MHDECEGFGFTEFVTLTFLSEIIYRKLVRPSIHIRALYTASLLQMKEYSKITQLTMTEEVLLFICLKFYVNYCFLCSFCSLTALVSQSYQISYQMVK